MTLQRLALIGGTLAALLAQPALAQEKVVYSQTSPSPNVASAPHSSIPAALGYWKELGLDVESNSVNGSTLAVQLTNAGTSDFTIATVEPLLSAMQQGADLVAYYNHTREPIYTIAVTKESEIQSLEDLKGKTIGVLSLSSGATAFAKAMLAGAGIDPDSDVSLLPIGMGQQAARAIEAGQVDAVALWDWAYAQLENAGLEFRHFTTPETDKLLSLAIIANGDYFREHPDVAAKFAQGIAKAAIFTLNNPEAAVKIHWEYYPESKPTGIPEDQALAEAVHLIQSRNPKYDIAGRTIEKWGAFTPEEWEATQDFLFDNGIITEKKDVAEYYTDELIEEINDFDADAVAQAAKDYE